MGSLNFKKVFIIITASIFGFELSIMLVLKQFNPSIDILETLIDSTLLIGFIMPIIFYTIYRPLRKQRDQAEVALKQKSLFLAKMSHEIRTPLNTILGISDYLYHEPETKKYNRHLNTMYRTGNHLLDVVNEILDFSKIESGHYNIEMKEFDLQSLLNTIIEQYDYIAKKKNIALTAEMSGLEPFAKGDRKSLTQILHNGFSNALKFNPAGGNVHFRVFKSSELNSKDLVFQIIDSGPGISKSLEGKIFQNYQQEVGGSQNFGGTGLGLAISKNLTELMGGTLSLKNNSGSKGSTFTLTLPLLLLKQTSIPEQGTDLRKIQKPLRILLADDSEDNRFVIQLFLSKLEITLDEVNDGNQAVELFLKNKYDLVLMDSEMPNLNGADAIKKMRSFEKEKTLRATPIVALSGHTSDEEIEKMNEAGCSIYLMKPVKKNQLLDIIYDFCEPREKFIEWSDKYSIRIKSIDAQHLVLVNLINNLYDAILKGHTLSQINEIIERLVAYADKHFSFEEGLLVRYQYSKFNQHKDGHVIFSNQISYYKEKFKKDSFSVSLGLLYYLKHWLMGHILEEDMQYAQEIKGKIQEKDAE